mgnify:CR=1 FL=1
MVIRKVDINLHPASLSTISSSNVSKYVTDYKMRKFYVVYAESNKSYDRAS